MAATEIHPRAVVDPGAEIGPDVKIGPGAVVEAHVVIGAGSRILANAVVSSHTTLGERCQVHPGAVLGGPPQDMAYKGEPTELVVRDETIFREGVSVNRATGDGCRTIIGSRCFLMAAAHVGHNCVVGDDVILANGALLGGHVHVADGAFLSALTSVHQFCRVGRMAMMGGGAGISLDLPPFMIAASLQANKMAGINAVGLRRAGFPSGTRTELKKAFRLLCRSGEPLEKVLAELDGSDCPEVLEVARFVEESERGVLRVYGTSRG